MSTENNVSNTADSQRDEERDGWVFQHITSDRCCQDAAKAAWDAALQSRDAEVRLERETSAQFARNADHYQAENKQLREALELVAKLDEEDRMSLGASYRIARQALKEKAP